MCNKDIVIGFDVSSKCTGWSCYNLKSKTLINFGKILKQKGVSLEEASYALYQYVKYIINNHSPGYVIIEDSFFGSNLKVLKKLELFRSAVKLACMAKGLIPLEIQANACRKVLGVKDKLEVFEKIKKLFKLKIYDFKTDNDITDSIALCLCFAAKQSEFLTSSLREKSLSDLYFNVYLGILLSTSCDDLSEKTIIVEGQSKDILELKYKLLPQYTTTPLVYHLNNKFYFKMNNFHFNHKALMKNIFSFFDSFSFLLLLSSSIQYQNKWVYFKINKNLQSYYDFIIIKLEKIYKDIKVVKLKTRFKIDRIYFDKVIYKEFLKNKTIKGCLKRKEIKLLLSIKK